VEYSRGECLEKLNRLLEISTLQVRFIKENRLEELLLCQAERDLLFSYLSQNSPHRGDPELKALADKIRENDKRLLSELSTVMGSTSSRLGHLKTGRSAIKAYGQGQGPEKRTIG